MKICTKVKIPGNWAHFGYEYSNKSVIQMYYDTSWNWIFYNNDTDYNITNNNNDYNKKQP